MTTNFVGSKLWPPKHHSFINLILALSLFALLVWLYKGVLFTLFRTLIVNEDYSYGLLLPFVSFYIVYLNWPNIKSSLGKPSWTGFIVIAFGFILLIFGKIAFDSFTPQLSIMVVLTGIILIIGGKELLRALGFPLLILYLILPLPVMLTSKITLPLQLISSKLAAGYLRFLGIPVVLQGNVIDMGVRQLQVVAACSGLRYFLSMIALGTIFCYFYQRRLWKIVLLSIFLVPTVIVANSLRVAAMGIFPELQVGFWHAFSGWLIFLFCFIALVLFNKFLNYLQPQSPIPAKSNSLSQEMKHDNFNVFITPYLATTLVISLLALYSSNKIGIVPPTTLIQSFDNFPLTMGSWQGKRSYLDKDIFLKTEADAYFDADYTNPHHEMVSLYIAYYERQASYSALVHNPNVCMTGGGWKTLKSGSVDIAPDRPVNFLILERDGVHLLVYYWHLQQGQLVVENNLQKLYMVFNGLWHRRTDWALVRLITPIKNDTQLANQRLTELALSVNTELFHFIKK